MAILAIHPGEHLAEELKEVGMSAAALARQLEVPTNRITEILNGQRAVTGDTALRLGRFFSTSAEFWLNLQKLYELRLAEEKLGVIEDAGGPQNSEMVEPPTLFRAVKDEPAARNHFDGVLWFRAHAYFHTIEGWAADSLEGRGTFRLPGGQVNQDITDDVPIQPAFVLCFSAEKNAAKKFGGHCLEVQNPMELKKRVEAALPDGGVTSVSWRKVEYGKTLDVKVDPGAGGWARKYWCKPDEFAGDKEWRLLVQFCHSLRILNKTLKLHAGRPTGRLFRLVSSD